MEKKGTSHIHQKSHRSPSSFAYLLDKHGGGSKISLEEVKKAILEKKLVWIHFDHKDPSAKKQIKSFNLNPTVFNTLFAQESRPRAIVSHEGLLLTIRHVNLNNHQSPEEMISMRIWLTKSLIISTHHQKLSVTEELKLALERKDGFVSASDFLKRITNQFTEDMTDLICDLDDQLDQLDKKVESSRSYSKKIRQKVNDLRLQIIMIKRYLLPQREAFVRLQTDQLPWINVQDGAYLREMAESTIRSLEDLDAARDRAVVLYEECMSQTQEQLNSKIYLLSVVAMIFMPLTFLTGLLGINVAGIPGAEYRYAFLIVSLIMLLIGICQLIWFRFKRWI